MGATRTSWATGVGIALLGLGACASDPRAPGPGAQAAAAVAAETAARGSAGTRTVHVVREGWHSGLVLRAADLPPSSPLVHEFPNADYLEVGWGDRAFYMAPNPGPWLALRALAWPTPGVLHLAAVPKATAGSGEDIAGKVRLTPAEFRRLHERLLASFDTDAQGRLQPLGPGLRGAGSRFYASRERFHLFKNCHTWTAQVLREARQAGAPSQRPYGKGP